MDYIYFTANPRIEPVYYVIALGITLVLGWFLRRRYRQLKITKERAVVLLLLTVYVYLVFASTVFSRKPQGYYNYELIPFWSYRKIIAGSWNLFWEDLFNVVMLMPLGMCLPVAWKRCNSLKQVIFFGALISLSIEFLQLILQRGLFEFDDLFHNTLGAAIGFWIYRRIKNAKK